VGFDTDVAAKYDEWYRKPEGRYADALERELFLRLVQPRKGQSLLEVGCGTGHNLEFFRELGLEVAGIDPSEHMLEIAGKKLQAGATLSLGQAEGLNFEDGSFDIVTLITVLEFCSDPAEALKEAARVAREKVYLGVLNKASLLAIVRRVKGRFRESVYNQAKFYTIWGIERMVKRELGDVPLTWGSVLFFPLGWHRYCHRADRLLSFRRTPFGAFLGVCINVAGGSGEVARVPRLYAPQASSG
jgi:ubiquinone/menaquinone biosynthesis C-methylase UbiE